MLKRSVVALALSAALASPALAEMPPPRYDHAYTGGRVFSYLVKYGEATGACNDLARNLGLDYRAPRSVAGRRLYGCSFTDSQGDCYYVYSWDPSGRDARMKSNTGRHERAHCNGWVHG